LKIKLESKLECLFGFFGMLIGASLLFLAVYLTPGFNPLTDTVSSLGEGNAKSLFSIAFVVGGSSGIPFYIYLERELVNIKDKVRRLGTGMSIFTSVCIALVGIIPDHTYWEVFLIFHGFVAFFSFIGSGIYIGLYSILMYLGPRTEDFTGIKFHEHNANFGFFVVVVLILLLITLQPIIEWILTISIIVWILLTSFHLIWYRIINIPVADFRDLNYPDLLILFEEMLKTLKKLDLNNAQISSTIKENLELVKDRIKKETRDT